ncbi:MAG: hypothetical protein H6P99_2555 [Holophagaceae bacterium]|nr:hypothetical protein [Holophagaceae bacterium]
MTSLRVLSCMATLVAGLASSLAAQDYPPKDWWVHLYDGSIEKLERIPIERPHVLTPIPIVRPAPPRFQAFYPFAGRPGVDAEGEFLYSNAGCLNRPMWITHNNHGLVLVCQEDATMKILDGAAAIVTPGWSGINTGIPVGGPLLSLPPLRTVLEWVQNVGPSGDLIRGEEYGNSAQWVSINPVTQNTLRGLALDLRERVWAVNDDGVAWFNARDGKATAVIGPGAKTPTGSPFVPVAVGCDPLVDQTYVASATAVYLVDEANRALVGIAGSPDKAGKDDGPLGQGLFSSITSIAVHDSGWILVVDDGHLRWVSPSGVISTQPALTPFGFYNLDTVFQVVFDRDMALLSDPYKHVIWRVF